MTTQYNVVTYGTLTNTNGVLSNFSASNYATLPLNFNQPQQPFEIVFKFNSNNISDEQVILQIGNDSTIGGLLDIEIYESKLFFELDADGTQRCYMEGVTTLSSNTDYWVKLTYNGIDTYSLYLSTNGTTWTTEGTTTSSYYLGTTQYSYIGIDQSLTTWYFNGSIDLNESYININNIRWWQGVTSTSDVITRIQLRHDTAANWASVNPVLLEGEVGLELDTRKQKVGDGVTAWNSLPYDTGSTALQSITSTNVTNALGYTPVNKSGDTMTGNLVISTDNTYNVNIALKNTNQTLSSIPSNNTFTNLAFTDNNNDTLGRVFLRDTTTGREMCLRVDSYNGNSTAFIAGFNTSNVAYCTFPNTTCCDGQWVSSYQEAIGSTAQTINAGATKNIPFSNLPAKNCEVMFTISQSTNYDLAISSSIMGGSVNRALKQGSICMIMPVSSDKTIKVGNLGSGTASITFVRMCGYRVLGTNTNT